MPSALSSNPPARRNGIGQNGTRAPQTLRFLTRIPPASCVTAETALCACENCCFSLLCVRSAHTMQARRRNGVEMDKFPWAEKHTHTGDNQQQKEQQKRKLPTFRVQKSSAPFNNPTHMLWQLGPKGENRSKARSSVLILDFSISKFNKEQHVF